MEEIIARLGRVGPANAAAGVNGIVPVVIVIGVDAVPAAVVRLERVMRPANASIGTGNHDSLASDNRGPRHQARVCN